MSGRVLHFGQYDGCEISYVVAADPAYILWAVENVPGHGISQYWINKAEDELDENEDYDPYMDFQDAWGQQ